MVTWNVGAATPSNIRYEQKDSEFVHEVLQNHEPPDLLVFGFQELVDLEDKKLTASEYFLALAQPLANDRQRAFSKVVRGRITPRMNI